MQLQDLIKDKSKIDIVDICSAWNWLINEQKSVLMVTIFGDLFLIGTNNEINWLDTGSGKLTKVANDVEDFKAQLKIDENFNNWFLGWLHNDIESSGIKLKENEVFSFKKLPIIGGEYSFENIEPVDISVHFYLSGQICEQTKNLADGTKVRIITSDTENKPWWKIWK